jgi:hypothetical protein
MRGGEGSPFLVMPELGPEAYIVGLWNEAGVATATGYGITKLYWQEIEAWLRIRNLKGELPLTPWEIDMVRRLSEEYSAEYGAASAKGHPAPYQIEDEDQLDRTALSSKFKNILSQFKSSDTNERYIVDEE